MMDTAQATTKTMTTTKMTTANQTPTKGSRDKTKTRTTPNLQTTAINNRHPRAQPLNTNPKTANGNVPTQIVTTS